MTDWHKLALCQLKNPWPLLSGNFRSKGQWKRLSCGRPPVWECVAQPCSQSRRNPWGALTFPEAVCVSTAALCVCTCGRLTFSLRSKGHVSCVKPRSHFTVVFNTQKNLMGILYLLVLSEKKTLQVNKRQAKMGLLVRAHQEESVKNQLKNKTHVAFRRLKKIWLMRRQQNRVDDNDLVSGRLPSC